MALVVNDRVKQTSTTSGTGTLDLSAAAVDGFQTFVAGIGDTNTTYYAIFNQGTTEWEVGTGTVTDAATDTLSRTTVYSSSNSGSLVDFASGTKDVFCTLPASHVVFGKQAGTNFTDSLLVGHSTTGTLNASQDNTGVGIGALDALTSGDDNTAVGSEAAGAINTGSNNVAIGSEALAIATDAIGNVAIGSDAMDSVTSGTNSVAVGYDALQAMGSGTNNTGIGKDSLAQFTGSRTTAIGYRSGYNLTSADGCVMIGSQSNGDSATDNRQLKIVGNDGTTATTWIAGDSSGNVVTQGTVHAAGGQLTTIGKALVMGF